MSSRKPFPQLNSFRSWVVDELRRRRTTWPTPINTPFARMTSCNEDLQNKYKYFTLGLHGFDGGDSVHLFDLTYGLKRDIVGYGYRQTDAGLKKELIGANEISYIPPAIDSFTSLGQSDPQRIAINRRNTQSTEQQQRVEGAGSHPIPGITSVSVKRSGLAAPLVAEVKWNCYNQQQLEFLRNHFLIIGSYIVLEWGQQFHNKTLNKILDFTDDNIDRELLNSIVLGRKFVIDNYSQPNDGNYDFIVGQVGNFTIDFEPQTNTYVCSTRIVSTGENVWGLNSANSFTNQQAEPGNPLSNRITDIHSYFGYGGRFDQLLGQVAKDRSKFVRPQTTPYTAEAKTVNELGSVGSGTSDQSFISWSMLTNDVLNDIIEMYNNVSVDEVTQSMLDKLRKELRTLLGLGGPPSKTLRPEIYQAQMELYENEWIGNHRYLRSADPDTLIVIAPAVSKIGPAAEWLGNGVFGDSAREDRGKLTSGIWLNTAMIRNAFLGTLTIQEAFQQILMQMNDAVANYWQLQLFYDDELSAYKVIDYKFADASSDIAFYVFNSNQNDHHNDVFDINFDSAFPPELITQMMIISMIQTSTPEKQAELFKRYPLINNTSPFMFAINWTSLRDILKDKIQVYRDSYNVETGQPANLNPLGTGVGTSNTLSSTVRIADGHTGPHTGATPENAGTPDTRRTVPGNITVVPQTADNTARLAPPRTTVLPPLKLAPTVTFDSLPLSSVVITSPYGARNAPTANASTNHGGVDLKAAQGTAVKAVKSGVVRVADFNRGGFGGAVYISHPAGIETWYGHLSAIYVAPGQKVSAGQLIGLSGGTPGTTGAGTSTGPHLHFELRVAGVSQNPEDSLHRRSDAVKYEDPNKNLVSTKPTTAPSSQAPISSSPTSPIENQTELSDSQLEGNYLIAVKNKFGSNMIALIAPSKSQLRNWITQDGYARINDNISNAYVAPYPTKTKVELKIQGMAGISISDGFMVDKLPFIFSQYGVFQVTEITDGINDKGWYTNIHGYFKMLWPDGRGGQRIDL